MILSRRFFIQASLSAAGGLMIAAFAPEFAGATSIAGEPWSPETGKTPDEVNAFVVIDPDNSITLRVPKSEMGQGVLTSLAMILAEELECDFAKVKVEYASAHRNVTDNNVYQSLGTGGSRSIRGSRVYLQQAGASARARLIAAAAANWGVAPTACVASGGLVRDEASGRSATFGELAADAAKVALAMEPAIKTPDQFKLIGASLKRIDTPLKVTGAARFGIDTRLPNMAYAAAANCPVFGGKLKSYDFSTISGRRGIIAAMPVTNGVAVVADNFWRAKEALAAMPIVWDFGPPRLPDSDEFRAGISRRALDGPLADGGGYGDLGAAFVRRRNWSRRSMRFRIWPMPRWSRSGRPRTAPRPHRRVWMGCTQARLRSGVCGQGGRRRSEGGVRPQLLPRRAASRPALGQRRARIQAVRGLEGPQAPDQADLDARGRHPLRTGIARRPRSGCAPRSGADGSPAGFEFRTALVGSILRSLGWDDAVQKRRRADGGRGPRQLSLSRRRASCRRQPQEHPCAGHVLALPRSARRRTPSRSKASSTRSPMRPGAIRSNTGARCCKGQARFPCGHRQARRQGRLGQAGAQGVPGAA